MPSEPQSVAHGGYTGWLALSYVLAPLTLDSMFLANDSGAMLTDSSEVAWSAGAVALLGAPALAHLAAGRDERAPRALLGSLLSPVLGAMAGFGVGVLVGTAVQDDPDGEDGSLVPLATGFVGSMIGAQTAYLAWGVYDVLVTHDHDRRRAAAMRDGVQVALVPTPSGALAWVRASF